MVTLQDLLLKRITKLTNEDLTGANIISTQCFHQQPLVSVEIPDSVKYIGSAAFNSCKSLKKVTIGKNVSNMGMYVFGGCDALEDIDTEKMNPKCTFIFQEFDDSAWYANHPENSMITVAKGRILVGNKMSKPSVGFEIPSTVLNLAPHACAKYGDTVDSNFTSLIVPDTVEMIQSSAFSGQSALTKITFGASVNNITGTIMPSNTVKDLIFRQPAGMEINLPKPGSDNGLAYNKDAYSMNIYTDNEYIKNYDWATDNVTATFYPLSSAPA